MSSKFTKEGYLFLDHRDSPGLPEEIAVRAGFPAGSGQGLFEAPSFTCPYCCRVVIMNPNRRRDRAYCSKEDRYICDDCDRARAAGVVLKTFKQICEEVQEAASKEPQHG